MVEPKELSQIIHSNVLEISRQMAGIILVPSEPVDMADADVLHLATSGEYQLNLYLCTDKKITQQIASNMKHGPAMREEMPLYAAEFFNILGGHIVSLINRRYKKAARFRPPVWEKSYRQGENRKAVSLFYHWPEGNLKVEGCFADGDSL